MARFVPDPGFEEALAHSPQAIAAITDRAKNAQRRAADKTRRGQDPRRGHLADQFRVEVDADGQVSLFSRDSFFHLLEYGSKTNRAEAPLRRAVQETPGVRLAEDPK